MNRDEIKKFISEQMILNGRINCHATNEFWFIKRNFENYFSAVMDATHFLDNNVTFLERIYCILKDIFNKRLCVICNCKVIFRSIKIGYQKTCSRKCLKIYLDQYYNNQKFLLDNDGLSMTQKRSLKAVITKNNIIDTVTGLNAHQISSIKSLHTRKTTILNNGLSISKNAGLKAAYTRKTTIDDNGLNIDQQNGRKLSTILSTTVLENGLTIAQNLGQKSCNTKLNDVDENGLNMHQRIDKKTRETQIKNIDNDGLNGYERLAQKVNMTKLNTLNDEGLNIYQQATKKRIQNEQENIDENGLNTFQRTMISLHAKNKLILDERGFNKIQLSALKGIQTKKTTMVDGVSLFDKAIIKANITKEIVFSRFSN